MSRRILSLLVFAMALLLAAPAGAQVEQLTLRVDGLACPFCAYGVEKKLKALEGYRSFDVRINEGKILLGWRDDRPLDLTAIEEAIRKSGFTLRGVRGRIRGAVTKDGERYLLSLPEDVDQRLLLFDPGTPDAPGGVGPELRERLEALAEREAIVAVSGPIHGHEDKGAPVALGVEELEARVEESEG